MLSVHIRVPGHACLACTHSLPSASPLGELRSYIGQRFRVLTPFRLRTRAGELLDDSASLGALAEAQQGSPHSSASGSGGGGGSSSGGSGSGGGGSPTASSDSLTVFCIFGAAWEAAQSSTEGPAAATVDTATAVSAAAAAAAPHSPSLQPLGVSSSSPLPSVLSPVSGRRGSSSGGGGSGGSGGGSSSGGGRAGGSAGPSMPSSPLLQQQEHLRLRLESLAADKARVLARLTPRLAGLSPASSPSLLALASSSSSSAGGASPHLLSLAPLGEPALSLAAAGSLRRRLAPSFAGGSGSSEEGRGQAGQAQGWAAAASAQQQQQQQQQAQPQPQPQQPPAPHPHAAHAAAAAVVAGLPAAAGGAAAPAAAPAPRGAWLVLALLWMERLQVSLLIRLTLVCLLLGHNASAERITQIATLLGAVYLLNLGLLGLLGRAYGALLACSSQAWQRCRGRAGAGGQAAAAPPAVQPHRRATPFAALARVLTVGIGYITCDFLAACLAFVVTLIPNFEVDLELRPLAA